MSETTEDTHKDSPSRWDRFRRTLAWEHLRPIVVAVAFVFGFMRPFVVEPFQIPSGSMEDTLLVGDRILVCKVHLRGRHPGHGHQTFRRARTRTRRCVRVCSPSHRNPGTSSNESSRSAATPSRRRVARSTSTASRSKMTLIPSVCPAVSAPATIFPRSAPPTSCPITTLLRITSSRQHSSTRSSRTADRLQFRRVTSSPWATIAIRAATAAPGAPSP